MSPGAQRLDRIGYKPTDSFYNRFYHLFKNAIGSRFFFIRESLQNRVKNFKKVDKNLTHFLIENRNQMWYSI